MLHPRLKHRRLQLVDYIGKKSQESKQTVQKNEIMRSPRSRKRGNLRSSLLSKPVANIERES